MKASTHREVYRPFQGELSTRRLRFWPIFVAGVRAGVKRKLPLLLLYAVPAIATIVFSFVVYAKFAAEESLLKGGEEGGLGLEQMFARQALNMLEVKNQIIEFIVQMRFFALLCAVWFGSGLFCDDRRAGAHLLYFARPILRSDYFLGKLLCAALFASGAVLLPGLVICLVASYTSPDWAFLREEWRVIVATVGYSAAWIAVASLVTLCASSLAPRRAFAMAGAFGFFMVTHGFGQALGEILDRDDLRAISPLLCMESVAHELFGKTGGGVDPALAAWVLGGIAAVSLAVIILRLRRLEVVA